MPVSQWTRRHPLSISHIFLGFPTVLLLWIVSCRTFCGIRCSSFLITCWVNFCPGSILRVVCCSDIWYWIHFLHKWFLLRTDYWVVRPIINKWILLMNIYIYIYSWEGFIYIYIYYPGLTAHVGPGLPYEVPQSRSFINTTLDRTPLDEWSARSRDWQHIVTTSDRHPWH